MLPLMKKSQELQTLKLKFQKKCHWTLDKEALFEELQ
jgi:hypothetical protein